MLEERKDRFIHVLYELDRLKETILDHWDEKRDAGPDENKGKSASWILYGNSCGGARREPCPAHLRNRSELEWREFAGALPPVDPGADLSEPGDPCRGQCLYGPFP